MDDFISSEDVVRVVREHGSDARIESSTLFVYPKDGCPGSPQAYEIPATGLGKRLVIQIARKCDIPTHLFWERPVLTLAVKKPA
jgi:hypothetical protein